MELGLGSLLPICRVLDWIVPGLVPEVLYLDPEIDAIQSALKIRAVAHGHGPAPLREGKRDVSLAGEVLEALLISFNVTESLLVGIDTLNSCRAEPRAKWIDVLGV